ncbi:hypothetical protein DPMN_012426 [Dreissena polymorpha]|uniref:Uncharacterized protein n=1 Tax=Dreissena polymorpha TaxID=45954 RepID=A0A9D4N2G3_DREPO|nr:hypothetical protein DPMN_012426 [Dreissena polymorpha]
MGEYAVVHIATGKDIKRALRCHVLAHQCLNRQLIAEMTQEDPEIQILLDHAEQLHSSLLGSRRR